MPSFSHESFLSKPDKNGFCQRLSIDALKPTRKKTAYCDIYDGMAFSNGIFSDDKHQKKMLVKFLRNTRNDKESHDFASHTVNLRESLENVAVEFNNSLKHMKAVKKDLPGSVRGNQIHFQVLQMNQLESVSFCDKKRRKGEYFVFGEKLPGCKVFLDAKCGIFERKISGQKRRRPKSVNYGEETPLPKSRSRTFSLRDDDDDVTESTNYRTHVCLHAFVHFYFCHKNGEMIVDFLRGIYSNESGYTLITPTVHSLSGGFGPNDCAEDGIRRVIESHRCNAFCKHLPSMKDIMSNAVREERSRKEKAPFESTNRLVDGYGYQQRAVGVSSWSSQDPQFGQSGSLDPNLSPYDRSWQAEATVYSQSNVPFYGQFWQAGATMYSQSNVPFYGQSWQERATYEKREEAQHEITRCFS